MTSPLESIFASRGLALPAPAPRADCPADETLAAWSTARLALAERRRVEDHALLCGRCHATLKALADLYERPVPAPASPLRVAARLLQHGLALLNRAELSFRSLQDGALVPALGALRGATGTEEEASTLHAIDGPGHGLDEIELAVLGNGAVQLMVRGDDGPPLHPGEVSSILLAVDGSPREKRPYDGAPLSFGPLAPGSYRLQLLARAPGGEPRTLAEATVELTR